MTPICLSIAGFDGSGGAGLQADLKTFSATGSYGMTVLTAVPVQNTCGVRACYDIPLTCIEQQLHCLFDDATPNAIKIGMLFSQEIITLVADFLTPHASSIPIILDPVMVSKSGHPLLEPSAIDALKHKLIPLAHLLTPNRPEADRLVGCADSVQMQGEQLLALGCQAVLLKGGHDLDPDFSNDWLMTLDQSIKISAKRVQTKNNHGTGCTLSAAIASYMAHGDNMLVATKKAKSYLSAALAHAKDWTIGRGHGPVHHFHQYWNMID